MVLLYLQKCSLVVIIFFLFFQTLDELTDNCRAQSTELVKTVSQHSQTKEEVRQIRLVCVFMWVWALLLVF